MTDLRQALHSFLQSKTDFTIINMMVQYNEPDNFVGYYFINDEIQSVTQGEREYNAVDDIIDVAHAPISLATVQLDVRGAGSFTESRKLFFGFNKWQQDLKDAGLYFKGTGNISSIPNVQNGYVKEGYQFNLFLGYDTSIVSQIDYAEAITWH